MCVPKELFGVLPSVYVPYLIVLELKIESDHMSIQAQSNGGHIAPLVRLRQSNTILAVSWDPNNSQCSEPQQKSLAEVT